MIFWSRALLLGIVNFLSLAIGAWLMDNGPNTDWYLSLAKAPWTPPGWFFGVVWTTIMLAFALYMAKLVARKAWLSPMVFGAYVLILLLCILWNYVYFDQHQMRLGAVILVALTAVLIVLMRWHYQCLGRWSWLLVPFIAWCTVATSLNIYTVVMN